MLSALVGRINCGEYRRLFGPFGLNICVGKFYRLTIPGAAERDLQAGAVIIQTGQADLGIAEQCIRLATCSNTS
jgi:hypothetical protein